MGRSLVRVLVTGGAGFVGSATSQALLTSGHAVTVVDDLRSGHRDAVPDGAQFHQADVTDRAQLDSVLRTGRFDACLHFAALIEAGESMRVPHRFFAVNTGGSANVLDCLIRHEVPRFVLSSTAAVYGEPDEIPVSETARLSPTNAYGASKLLVEQMLGWLHQISNLRVGSLRYFNAAGATEHARERHEPETHLIPIVLQVAAGDRPTLDVFGTDYPTKDGTAVRDYIHVADLADAHVSALERLDEFGTIACNLGTGSGSTVREVIAATERVTGCAVAVSEAPRRPGDPAVLVASNDRAQQLLDWEPKRSELDRIIGDAWAYARPQ